MDAAVLIASLVDLEQTARREGDFETRNFVIEAQDCILRMQRENLALRQENQVLRLRQGTLHESTERKGSPPADKLPFLFQSITSRRSGQMDDSEHVLPIQLSSAG
jgi:hypothetical protein